MTNNIQVFKMLSTNRSEFLIDQILDKEHNQEKVFKLTLCDLQ